MFISPHTVDLPANM